MVATAAAGGRVTHADAGAKGGREKNEVDNINSVSPKGGTSETYLLRRLKRERPRAMS
jgi:hypothetical protein